MKRNDEVIAVPRRVIERRAKEMLLLKGQARNRKPSKPNDLVTYAQVVTMIQNGVVDGLRQYDELLRNRRADRRLRRWIRSRPRAIAAFVRSAWAKKPQARPTPTQEAT